MTTDTAPPQRGSAALTGRGYGPVQLVQAEWTKLRSVRSTAWTLGVTLLLVIGIGALATYETAANWHSGGGFANPNFDPTSRSLAGLFFGEIAIGVLGVLAMSAEYSSGTIRATFSAAPKRILVLACKAAVFGAVILVFSEVICFVAFFIGQALLKGTTPYATIGEPGVARAVAGSGLVLTLAGLFALALATIIRHTAGAIAAYVAILLVLPLILAAFPFSIQHSLTRYMPLVIAENMATTHPTTAAFGGAVLFSPWAGFAVFCGYAVFLFVIGGLLLVRRDT